MTLTGREKATIFLSILGSDISSRILRYLPPELADLIASGINHLPTPSPDALAEVIDEYQSFLALPGESPSVLPEPVVPQKSYAALLYERPQTIAFLISILPEEEKRGALFSITRERTLVEELIKDLKINPLRPILEEKLKVLFAGKIF